MQQEKESEGKNRKNNNRAEGQLTEATTAATSADLAMPYTAHCCDSTPDSIDKDLDGGMKLKQ